VIFTLNKSIIGFSAIENAGNKWLFIEAGIISRLLFIDELFCDAIFNGSVGPDQLK